MRTASPKILKKTEGKQREGKGFSRGELALAGTVPKDALKLGIPIDLKRKTVHEGNVETLKQLLQSRQTAAKGKKKTKS